jgi:hypothetical protein
MAAVILATKTAPQMVFGGKNQQPRLKIKLSWQKTLRNGAVRFGSMELQYTVTTDAGFIT